MSGVRVYMRHLRQLRYCSYGARVWFERRGWDWGIFLREGLPVEEFEATGDAMALRLVEVVRGRR